tara:strand:- start:572 stop:871 length:300 start_codon:yes stop_codon:yes gene_type:complete
MLVTDNLKTTIMKKYRNENGDLCYVFAWECGGGNSVFAESKRSALRRAKKFGAGTHDRNGYKHDKPYKGSVLVPNEKSMRSVTYEELKEFDRGLYLMTI